MNTVATTRPLADEYSDEVTGYIRLVPEGDLIEIFSEQNRQLTGLLSPLSDAEALVHHPPYTWSLKQVVGHLTDCERVFGYRVLRLARGDATPLPGFDENAYMLAMDFDCAPLAQLVAEFDLVRRSHVLMLGQLPPDAWLRRGTVNGYSTTTRALAAVMAGHLQHHLQIVRQRLGR